MKKLQLMSIALAPNADEMMQPYPAAHSQRERLFQSERSQPGHFRAIGRMIPNPDDPAHLPCFDEIHVCFPNQFVSKQRRSAMRARCSITHRLFSEMFNSLQISSLSTPSTSRIVNTVAMLLGSLREQSW